MSYIVVPNVELCIIAKQGLGCQRVKVQAQNLPDLLLHLRDHVHTLK